MDGASVLFVHQLARFLSLDSVRNFLQFDAGTWGKAGVEQEEKRIELALKLCFTNSGKSYKYSLRRLRADRRADCKSFRQNANKQKSRCLFLKDVLALDHRWLEVASVEFANFNGGGVSVNSTAAAKRVLEPISPFISGHLALNIGVSREHQQLTLKSTTEEEINAIYQCVELQFPSIFELEIGFSDKRSLALLAHCVDHKSVQKLKLHFDWPTTAISIVDRLVATRNSLKLAIHHCRVLKITWEYVERAFECFEGDENAVWELEGTAEFAAQELRNFRMKNQINIRNDENDENFSKASKWIVWELGTHQFLFAKIDKSNNCNYVRLKTSSDYCLLWN